MKRKRSRNGRNCKPRRRVLSLTCGKLARDPMLIPSGRRRRSTRRRTRRRMKRKRRKLLSTFNDRLVRRNLTSISLLLTRVDAAEVNVDVVVAAEVHPTGSAVKVRRVSVAHQGSPGSQDP